MERGLGGFFGIKDGFCGRIELGGYFEFVHKDFAAVFCFFAEVHE